MIPNKKYAVIFAALAIVCAATLSVCAQTTTDTKPVRARFEVLHMMYNAIQVRSLSNEREVHTFTYSDGIRGDMQNLFNRGGYQYGDKIEIWYQPGAELALKIKGKPSKPL